MRLSKNTRLLALNIINYVQYICDRLDDTDAADHIAKTRCKNILDLVSKNITVIPKQDVPIPDLVNSAIVAIDHFIKTANQEAEHPTIRNLTLIPDRQKLRTDTKMLTNAFGQLLDTLTWYRDEKHIEP